MSSENDKDTSFADPSKIDGKEETQKKQPQGEYPLFKKLDAIVEAIKEQTKASVELKDAMNNLLTSFIVKSNKVEPKPQVQLSKEVEKKSSPAELPYDIAKITWTPCNNGRMAYPDAPANKENKDFKAMQTFLQEVGGSTSSKGGLWYKIFDNGAIFEKSFKKEETKETPQQSSQQPLPLPKQDNSKLEVALGHIPPQPNSKVDQIKMLFPEDLENMLMFTEEGDGVTIKPRQFLGSENFAKIASVVRGAGGEYVSAGKASHFRIKSK